VSEYRKFYAVCPNCREWEVASTKQKDSNYSCHPWVVYNDFCKFNCEWGTDGQWTSPVPVSFKCNNCQHADCSGGFLCNIVWKTCPIDCPKCGNNDETEVLKLHQAATDNDYWVMPSPFKEFSIETDSKAVSKPERMAVKVSCNKCNWKYSRNDVSCICRECHI